MGALRKGAYFFALKKVSALYGQIPFLLPRIFSPERGKTDEEQGKRLKTSHEHGNTGNDFRSGGKICQTGKISELCGHDTRITHGHHRKSEGAGDIKTGKCHEQSP